MPTQSDITGASLSAAAKRAEHIRALAAKIGQGQLDSAIHDVFSSQASGVNNRGTEAQIRLLLEEGWSEEDILKASTGEPLDDGDE